jgi:choline dehydrogenase-like flavoprotein
MAPRDLGGVVDNRGRVYGIHGARVADISVAPIQPDGNTAGPAYFVGWNIARLLLQEYDPCK